MVVVSHPSQRNRTWHSHVIRLCPIIFLPFPLTNGSFVKIGSKRYFWYKMINSIYYRSNSRGYIDVVYARSLTRGIRGLTDLTDFFDRRVIDGITNGVGILSFFLGESNKYVGGGRRSSHISFGCLSYSSIWLSHWFDLTIPLIWCLWQHGQSFVSG